MPGGVSWPGFSGMPVTPRGIWPLEVIGDRSESGQSPTAESGVIDGDFAAVAGIHASKISRPR